ncbi:MAG: hypothetical protein K2W88_18495, partial [Pararheinheimera sp.]|nr:hypothetical protein [Rheinheimera sp.]
MINREAFFRIIHVKLFNDRMTTGQVEGCEKIITEYEWRHGTKGDLRRLACQLATVFHETGQKMQPVREGGGEAYLKTKKYYPWVGEGLVQVTWEANARKFGATAPGQLMTWPVALKALFDGMEKGLFTGKKLADYFSKTKEDWVGSRAIINGKDCAAEIAGYGRTFNAALRAAADSF